MNRSADFYSFKLTLRHMETHSELVADRFCYFMVNFILCFLRKKGIFLYRTWYDPNMEETWSKYKGEERSAQSGRESFAQL